MATYHQSVLLKEVLSFLKVKKNEWYLDCTLGAGGYGVEIIKLGGKYLGIDQDPQAISLAKQRFSGLGVGNEDFNLIRGNFKDLKTLVKDQKFNGVIFDLGVSSMQLDDAQRGFSFSKEAMLDMRMDPDLQVTAMDLVNGLNKGELVELFMKYGEVGNAKKIAEKIVTQRTKKPITSTTQLAQIASQAQYYPTHSRIHPATTIFQALRIAVNDELNNLKTGLWEALDVTEGGGRVLVISFHSGEDRIVKNMFKEWKDLNKGQILTDKPIEASKVETDLNPRSRSAKLRVFQKK